MHALGMYPGTCQSHGPIGTLLFASAAADACVSQSSCETHPADDVESLAYMLAYLAAGRLPWHGHPGRPHDDHQAGAARERRCSRGADGRRRLRYDSRGAAGAARGGAALP
eukprot:1691217-Prymnesium_polylepis.1